MGENKITYSLSDHFLIATPQITDPYFSHSVVYIFEHNQNGAMGVIINKPSPLKMEHLFKAIEKETPKQFEESWLLLGGPVQIDRGFLIHTPVGNWQSSLLINDNIAVTTSKDIIESLFDEQSMMKSLATIGYSAWTEGQLESEMNENAWIAIPANQTIMFDLPYHQRYEAALGSLGIKAYDIMAGVGHA
ncbi:MAG: YqgE/AlgH family protein [Neisseriaceae bacterium]|nr:MAG: YqgE/AlgH family protein [Neisseriaceae bacterium]